MIGFKPLRKFLVICLVMYSPVLSAETSMQPPTLNYTKIYTDSAGVSHFAEGSIDFTIENYAPPAPPLGVHHFVNGKGATLVHITRGVFEDWHPAPRRQFMFILQGTVEVGVSNGEVRQFEPGSVVLLEDTTGKGHTTEAIGDEDHISVAVPEPPRRLFRRRG